MRLLAALLFLSLGASTLTAQTPTPLPAELTLSDALAIARERNPAYRVHAAELAAADAEERSAASWLQFLPNVSFGLGAQLTQSRIITGYDDFGRQIKLDDPITNRRIDSSLGPSFSQITLFDGGETIRQARSRRAGVRGTRARVAAEAIRLESQLIRDYYAVLRAEKQVELNERLLESTRVNLDAAQRLLRVGIQDPLDVLSAELAVAQAENQLEQSRGEVRKARLTLGDAMGLPSEQSYTLADDLPEVVNPASLDVETLIAGSVTGSPSVLQAEAASTQSRYSLLSANARRWPTVNLTLGMSPGLDQGSGSNPLFYLNPMNQTYRVGLSFRLNLFDRFEGGNRIAQAEASYLGAQEGVRAARLAAESEIRSVMIDLENIYRTLSFRERFAELSRERLELSQQKYQMGAMSFNELQTTVNETFQAEFDALGARFDFATSLVALEELVGRRLRGL